MPSTPPLSPAHRRLVAVLLGTALAGSALFTALAVQVASGRLPCEDPAVTARAVGLRHPWLTYAAWTVTHLGGTTSLTVLTILVCAVLAARGRRSQAGAVLATMAGSATLTVLLKLVFARQRPGTHLLLGEPADTFSFPSGHSFNTAVLVGALAGIVLVSDASRCRRATATGAAVAAALLVGLSRVYLAYHWLTDVLAGWSLAVAWLSLVAVTVVLLRARRPRAAQE